MTNHQLFKAAHRSGRSAYRARIPVWLLALAWAASSTMLYLAAGRIAAGEMSFPLDDAWIHQTLARSLAQTGTLAVNPGQPVAASTSPLWSAVLAVGYLLGAPPAVWAWGTGSVSFAAVILGTRALGRTLFPQRAAVGNLAAVFTALDWHLAWSAASGMETALFVALALVVLRLGARPDTPLPLLGLAGGLATLARPEGSVIFFGALLTRVLIANDRRWQLAGAVGAVALFGLVLSPVVFYHLTVFGHPLPATFFAKGAYYREPLSAELLARYSGGVLATLLAGPLLVLFPAAAVFVALSRRRPSLPSPSHLLAAGGLVGLPLLYLVWLPQLYHHGRYLFPLIPVALLYAVAGAMAVRPLVPLRMLARSMAAVTGGVALATWLAGAVVFAADARTIATQQIQVARWLATASPSDAVVATHDVGAIGYFAGRQVVDMAGLITPALTTSPRDRQRIIDTLRREGVTYAAVLPDWYPWFPGGLPAVEVHRLPLHRPGRNSDVGFRVFQLDWRSASLP